MTLIKFQTRIEFHKDFISFYFFFLLYFCFLLIDWLSHKDIVLTLLCWGWRREEADPRFPRSNRVNVTDTLGIWSLCVIAPFLANIFYTPGPFPKTVATIHNLQVLRIKERWGQTIFTNILEDLKNVLNNWICTAVVSLSFGCSDRI